MLYLLQLAGINAVSSETSYKISKKKTDTNSKGEAEWDY